MNVRRSNVSRRANSKQNSTQDVSNSKNSSVTKRLMKELSDIMMANDSNVTAFPMEDDTFKWTGKIKGPEGSVYSGKAYKMSLKFPATYPYEAPTITFATPCFHPNVDMAGNICLDTLKERWSSCNSVHSILVSIQSLLQDPNVSSPLNARAATLWENQTAYKEELDKHSKEAFEVYKEWQ
ncbi:probable ubiquitin-conjugating enzyme E2 C [Clytia hemisphaerica]|uniref:UBC core domain-containing protein n=1 Tax=Clytia hemisphaerica TaxID=252671 RepID=A0A7M5WVA3_9CNID